MGGTKTRTRRRRSKSRSNSRSRRSKSSHSYFMRGCSRRHRSNSNKHDFFAKGGPGDMKLHGKLRTKKCKCACHLDKHHVPECKCNCHQMSRMFGGEGEDAGNEDGNGNADMPEESVTEVSQGGGRRRRLRGGDALNLSLAYTGKQASLSPSPYGAYVGKGGSHTLGHANVEKTYPVVTDTGGKMGWPNAGQTTRGGGITGAGTSYANGLVGSSWTGNSNTWPGVSGGGGDSNHLSLNTYNNDISRDMQNIGANYPHNGMLHGGNRRSRSRSRSRHYKHGKSGRGHRGGGLIPQNLVNVGRNFMYNIGVGNNAINGYESPVNPMPYEGQLVSDNSKFFNI
jgi:hypothetical protein